MNLEKLAKLIEKEEAELKLRKEQNAEPSNLAFLELSIEHLKRNYEKGDRNPVDVNAIIEKLKNMDLASFPYDEAKPLISQLLTVFPVMITFLYPENQYANADSFIRARPYRDGEAAFNEPSQLGVKPQKFNSTFQRASTPNQTMFYGCLKKYNGQDLKIDNRFTACMESLQILRDKDKRGVKKIAFGKWIVTEQIQVVTVINSHYKNSDDPALRKLYENFYNYSKEYGLENEALAITEFIAEKFGDENAGEGKEHLYLLSAMFTEAFVSDMRIDGVLYPSVRTAKDGICVALTEKAFSKLKLVAAGESIIYKTNGEAVIDNSTFTFITDNATTFDLKPVDAKYIMGEANVLKKLGVSSIIELL
jgi:hypothetical protein